MFFALVQGFDVGIVPSSRKKHFHQGETDMGKPHTKPYKNLHARIIINDETDSSIAAKVGLSQQQMSARMSGLCSFSVVEMARIGKVLAFTPEDYYHLFILPTITLKGE